MSFYGECPVIWKHQLLETVFISWWLLLPPSCTLCKSRLWQIESRKFKLRSRKYGKSSIVSFATSSEFEGHLSSFAHNHRKRFKEMREMYGSSSRDDRQKRELHQEKEMAKFAQMADAHKQQQQQQQQEDSEKSNNALKNATIVADQDQRKALKFGFSSKVGASKNTGKSAAKKPKVPIASVFGNDSDEE